MKGILKKAMAAALVAVMVLSMSGCTEEEQPQTNQPQQEQQQDDGQQPETQQEQEEQSQQQTVTAPSLSQQLKEAKAKNDDIIGWLKIDDLKVDGAVVQAENNTKYERLNEWGQYSWTGTYFADYECNFDSRESLSKNTVIYGHNVDFNDNRDGERFSQLLYFADEEFAKQHPYVYFTIDGDDKSSEMVWEIFSVFYTTTDFDYIRINKDYRNPQEGEITDAQLMNIIKGAQERVLGNKTIVTNGDQTDTIYELMDKQQTFEQALRTREFEPDGPNYTPRISGIMHVENGEYNYVMSILKSNNGNPDACNRYTFAYENPVAGEGHFIHTYMCDGNPLPSFEGEPKWVETMDDMNAFADMLWESLNEDNKVSLFVRYIDIETGKYESIIKNKNK